MTTSGSAKVLRRGGNDEKREGRSNSAVSDVLLFSPNSTQGTLGKVFANLTTQRKRAVRLRPWKRQNRGASIPQASLKYPENTVGRGQARMSRSRREGLSQLERTPALAHLPVPISVSNRRGPVKCLIPALAELGAREDNEHHEPFDQGLRHHVLALDLNPLLVEPLCNLAEVADCALIIADRLA